MATETNNVDHPNHYTDCSLECIDVMELMFGKDNVARWCVITAYKYLHRYKFKNGLEDLEKAEWYLNKATEYFPACSDISERINDMRGMTEKFKKELIGG